MKEIYKEGMQLIFEEKYEEAYKYFDDLVKKDINNFEARYIRASIDFYYLSKNLEVTLEDFKLLITKKIKNYKKLYPLVVLILDRFNMYSEVVNYGEIAKKINSESQNAINLCLGRAYYFLGNGDNENSEYYLNKSLDCFLNALDRINLEENEEDSNMDKINIIRSIVDVTFSLKMYEDCLMYIDMLIELGASDGSLYYYRGVSLYNNAETDEEFENAIYNLDKSLNYFPGDVDIISCKGLALGEIGKIEEAEKLLLNEYSKEKDNIILRNLILMYFRSKQIEKIRTVISNDILTETLKSTSAKAIYAKALDFLGEEEEKLYALELNKEIYKSTFDFITLQLIVGRHKINNDYQGLLDFIESIDRTNLEINSNVNISIESIKAICYQFLDYNFDKYNDIYHKLAINFTCENDYLYSEIFLNPNRNKKVVSKYIKYAGIERFDERFIASLYLYGDYPFKINHKKIHKLISGILKYDYHNCNISLLGRVEELVDNNYEKAREFYEKAYKQNCEQYNDYCNCACGLYARIIELGLIDSINKETGHQIILNEIKKNKLHNSSNVNYMYAYYALQEIEGFSKEVAIELVKYANKDSLYDLDGKYLLAKLYEDIDIQESSKYLGQFYNKFSQASQLQQKYYKDNLKDNNDSLIVPLLNNR